MIVITGSSGKTTVLHLLESQIGEEAYYSHKANSSYGIPFNILGMERGTLSKWEWPLLFLKTPFAAYGSVPAQKIYVAEVDCDRPSEGLFLATLLKPHTTLWISSSRSHSVNFDHCVTEGTCDTVEEAVAKEYGSLLEYTQDTVYYNGDNPLIKSQAHRTHAQIHEIIMNASIFKYTVFKNKTDFTIGETTYTFNYLLPQELFYGLSMVLDITLKLGLPIDTTFSRLELPPGRNSLFTGTKDTTLIDGSYNANLSSMAAVLSLFEKYPAHNKWIVLGGLLDQGKSEVEEHEKLAALIPPISPKKVILFGQRANTYIYPKLKVSLDGKCDIVKFETQRQVLEFLQSNLKGEETILFKGGTLLEGVIEHLLADKEDVSKLCRREKIWQLRRQKAGL
ncbi:hypothetical protein A3H83_01730 [Candidatus Roizmanbacteria bacterium RIFCSPLOWO2_02_FULL_39_8]|nr:MAG: hypothetical protein A3H83_01730 [Candidatus Roizmanbacteria bacterium RIFCSPLOWO2_02_FULL_39_8]